MRCSQCGAELNEQDAFCPACHQQGSVKILSHAERDSFTGETIDAPAVGGSDGAHGGNYYEYKRYDRYEGPSFGQRIYKFSLLPTTFWGRAALVLATGLLFFIALPLFFLAVLFGTLIGMLFFKKR